MGLWHAKVYELVFYKEKKVSWNTQIKIEFYVDQKQGKNAFTKKPQIHLNLLVNKLVQIVIKSDASKTRQFWFNILPSHCRYSWSENTAPPDTFRKLALVSLVIGLRYIPQFLDEKTKRQNVNLKDYSSLCQVDISQLNTSFVGSSSSDRPFQQRIFYYLIFFEFVLSFFHPFIQKWFCMMLDQINKILKE